MRSAAFWGVWLWVGATLLNAQPQPTLTLDEALQLAEQQNRRLAAARLVVEQNEELRKATAAQRLPKLSTQVQHLNLLTPLEFTVAPGVLGTYPGVGPIPNAPIPISSVSGGQTSVKVSVTQPLTQVHKIDLSEEIQADEVEVARQTSRSTELSLQVQVRQSYFALVDLQNALDANQESLDFVRELERVTGEYLKEKTALKADLYEVQASRADSEYQRRQLLGAEQTQKEQLNLLLGRDLTSAFTVTPPLVPPGVREELTELQQQSLSQRPDLHQSRLRLKQALTQRELERARYIPDVSLQLSSQFQSNSGLLPGQIVYLALVAEWDAWDWGYRDRQIAARDKQAEAAQKQLEEAQAAALIEINSRYRKVEELQALELARKALLQAREERHRVTLQRYMNRAALVKDLLESQAQLAGARRDYRKAQLDWAQAVAELYQAVGRVP